MTKDIEYAKNLLEEYQIQLKDFENSKELECFWKGACFALKVIIKHYERENENDKETDKRKK